MTAPAEMQEAAARGQLALQRCTACGRIQYPPRELCGHCLEDQLAWEEHAAVPGEVLAATVLRHSNDAEQRAALPLRVGLVRLAEAATAVCFLDGCASGDRVRVAAGLDAAGRPVLVARAQAGGMSQGEA